MDNCRTIPDRFSRRAAAVFFALVCLTVTIIGIDVLLVDRLRAHPGGFTDDYLLVDAAFLSWSCVVALCVSIGVSLGGADRVHRGREDAVASFRALIGPSPTVAYLKDSTGRILYVNDAYCNAVRIERELLVGKLLCEVMPPEIAEQLGAHDRKVIESRCAHQFEESMRGEAGVLRHWMSFKFPVAGPGGEVFLAGVSVEVTEMVDAQNALRESESRFRQIVEYSGDIMVRCDNRGRVTYINEMGARILKIPSNEICGKRALRLVRPDYRRQARTNIWRELAKGTTDLYMEVPVTTGDATEMWLGQTVRVMRTSAEVQGFHAVCRDITDRRRMEAELRVSEERFRLLYENGPVAYHEINGEGVIQRVNRAECELLGYSEAELVGRSVVELMAPEERPVAREAIRAKVRQENPLQPFIRVYQRSDGRRLRLEIHENLLRDNHGDIIGIHSVLLDVTQRYLAEMLDRDRWKVSEMMAQQQPLDRVLPTIAAMISHQDESLLAIPIRFNDEQLEPVCSGTRVQPLDRIIRELGKEVFAIWPVHGFRVNHHEITELQGCEKFREFAVAARGLGIESCWSIPIASSCQQPVGLLVVLSPRIAAPTHPEQKMLEAAGRISALAIEHRYLTDLLAFQASHDCLTRLPNRSSFEARLQDAIACAGARGEQLAVFYVDLDKFKEVNDTFGHSGGDELLRQVASRLRRSIRRTDTLARIGGDEFSLLLTDLRDVSEASRLAEAILHAFRSPFEIGGWEVHITPSIGISFYPKDGLDAPTLQRNSDTAMYRVKNAGKNSFRCYAEGGQAGAEMVV